jgi:hypothetical protein
MQQQLAGAAVVGDDVGGCADQRWDRGTEEVDLALADDGVAVAEVDPSGPQGFDFPALERDARLVAPVDVLLVPGALVERDGATCAGFVLRFRHVVTLAAAVASEAVAMRSMEET